MPRRRGSFEKIATIYKHSVHTALKSGYVGARRKALEKKMPSTKPKEVSKRLPIEIGQKSVPERENSHAGSLCITSACQATRAPEKKVFYKFGRAALNAAAAPTERSRLRPNLCASSFASKCVRRGDEFCVALEATLNAPRIRTRSRSASARAEPAAPTSEASEAGRRIPPGNSAR